MGNENNVVEKKTRSSVQLIEELIEEILSRLPAKSLLRFSCVSRSWRSLIGNKRFIKNHLQNISKIKSNTHWRALFNCQTNHGLMQRSMQSYLDESSLNPSPFDDPKNNHMTTKGAHVVDHCNGVLCIYRNPDSFFLWNPTTRTSIELPKIEHKNKIIMKYGFGWDEESDAYKVFVGLSDPVMWNYIGKVYSTKTNSWKQVEYGTLSLSLSRNVIVGNFASGKIHWLSLDGLRIETFDLKSEVFGMMENPCKAEVGAHTWLYNYRGCLTVLSDSNDCETRRVWLMKEYGAKDSWAKMNLRPPKNRTSCCRVNYFYIESLASLDSLKE